MPMPSNMPNKIHNTVVEGIANDYHNASEQFGSRNPDDPDDPGTTDDGADLGQSEKDFDSAKAEAIEQDLAAKDGIIRHIGESAIVAETQGAQEINEHNHIIFQELLSSVKNDLAKGEATPRRVQYSNAVLDILADVYSTIENSTGEDVRPLNSILEDRLENYREQIKFFENQYQSTKHARAASNHADITEALIAQVASIELDYSDIHQHNTRQFL